jgi:hypothetical protein
MAVRLEVLPAERGDCLWVECDREGAAPWRMLVDGGLPTSWPRLRGRLNALPADRRRIDLAVISHIDSDHIGGMLPLLADTDLGLEFGDIWFNSLSQLPDPVTRVSRSVPEGERLSQLLAVTERALPWNEAFAGAAVMTHGDGAVRTLDLPHGPTITLLSPTPMRLEGLRRVWTTELGRLRRGEPTHRPAPQPGYASLDDLPSMAGTNTSIDGSATNGSSIAFLLEHQGASLLLAADAFPTVLGHALTTLINQRGGIRLAVDIFKLPHHASQGNVICPLMTLVAARHYVVSTNGDRFHHPDDVALARVVTSAPAGSSLWFNYATPAMLRWGAPALCSAHRYLALFGRDDDGVRLEV